MRGGKRWRAEGCAAMLKPARWLQETKGEVLAVKLNEEAAQ
jgi:hypothetical protein